MVLSPEPPGCLVICSHLFHLLDSICVQHDLCFLLFSSPLFHDFIKCLNDLYLFLYIFALSVEDYGVSFCFTTLFKC